MTYQPINLDRLPAMVMRAWPRDWRLAALCSGGGNARSRWTLLARPTGEVVCGRGGGRTHWPELLERPVSDHAAPTGRDGGPPFTSGWLGALGYEFGRVLEPKVARGTDRAADGSLSLWQRFEDALAFDHATGCWWGIGSGAGELAAAVRDRKPQEIGFTLSPLRSRTGREGFERAVATAIEHIRAGDIYQVNLTHALRAAFAGSSRGFFLELLASASPWYGCYLEPGEGGARSAIASVSPELFLAFDPSTRRVETRPMKGTRRVERDGKNDELERADLAHSAKDRAELAMIVDLMRNDLGRVCEARSVRVDDDRAMERHSSLLQTTATVSGTLPPHRSLADLLRATFPGGSITGVPKVRAMQIIEDLEAEARGPYCGSMGYVGDDGSLALNIAIRTAVVRGRAGSEGTLDSFVDGTLDYGVGAGIVADSDPGSEWEETLAKAAVIERIAGVADARGGPARGTIGQSPRVQA